LLPHEGQKCGWVKDLAQALVDEKAAQQPPRQQGGKVQGVSFAA
jgi:hypothetical protein